RTSGAQIGLRGHEDHRHVRIARARRRENLEAGDAGHPHVREHHVRRALLDLLEPLATAQSGTNLEALLPEEDAEGLEDPGFVVDHEDVGAGSGTCDGHAASASAKRLRGRSTVNRVPRDELSTSTTPRWASTARCTMGRPSPVPPGFVVKKG